MYRGAKYIVKVSNDVKECNLWVFEKNVLNFILYTK